MLNGIADVTSPQGFDTKSEGSDYSCNTSVQAPHHFGATAQHIGTNNPLPCRRIIITLPAKTVYSPTKNTKKNENLTCILYGRHAKNSFVSRHNQRSINESSTPNGRKGDILKQAKETDHPPPRRGWPHSCQTKEGIRKLRIGENLQYSNNETKAQ